MTKEEIVSGLERRLLNINPSVVIHRTPWKDQSSDWSRQFCIPECETTSEFIKNVFGINCEDWKDKYEQVVSGAGKEGYKITTLHSSSLLVLLCFSNVSRSNCLKIGGKIYNKVRFEVKNNVFDNPSNIDIVLQNDETGDLLFLESKFTEYLSPDNNAFAKKYFNFYVKILPMIKGLPLQMVYPRKYRGVDGMGLKPTSEKRLYSHLYMDGIKQCFSHIIGICQGPAENEKFKWGKNSSGGIRFGSILYKISGDSFRSYKNFYSRTIGKIDSNILRETFDNLKEIDNNFADRIEILPDILTYQNLVKENPNWLDENVKIFYDL